MIDLFMPFRSFLKFDNVCTDNNVFRMHYKITVIMLLVFTLLVTSKQFFGEPIHCIAEGEHNDKDAVNSYCWIYGTYTLKSNLYGEFGSNFGAASVPCEKSFGSPASVNNCPWLQSVNKLRKACSLGALGKAPGCNVATRHSDSQVDTPLCGRLLGSK